MASPCAGICYSHGILFSEEKCKDCDYYRLSKILKEVLITQDSCYASCKYSTPFKGGFWDCSKENECNECDKYEMDLDKIIKDYRLTCFDDKQEPSSGIPEQK
jgi:hypothetical protein